MKLELDTPSRYLPTSGLLHLRVHTYTDTEVHVVKARVCSAGETFLHVFSSLIQRLLRFCAFDISHVA